MIDLLEALMILCFGISWPISIYKSWTSQTAKGKSLTFEIFIWFGYILGLTRKILQIRTGENFEWVFYLGMTFYILNLIEITIDILLYFRNKSLDQKRDALNSN